MGYGNLSAFYYAINLARQLFQYLYSLQNWDAPKEYQFVYGVGFVQDRPNDLFNQLLKIDILQQHKVSRWYEQGCYLGEPIFVPQPNSEQEDEGVILGSISIMQ